MGQDLLQIKLETESLSKRKMKLGGEPHTQKNKTSRDQGASTTRGRRCQLAKRENVMTCSSKKGEKGGSTSGAPPLQDMGFLQSLLSFGEGSRTGNQADCVHKKDSIPPERRGFWGEWIPIRKGDAREQ